MRTTGKSAKANNNRGGGGQTPLVRFITKRQLREAQKQAARWGYNRQICADLDLTRLGNFRFPVTLAIPHEHRRMQRCEPHVRLTVFVPHVAWSECPDFVLMDDSTHLVFDVPTYFFAKLTGKWLPAVA